MSDLQFALAARSRDVTGIPDTITLLETCSQRPCGADNTRGVPAEDAGATRWNIATKPNLGIDGVDRHRFDFDQQVVVAKFRRRHIDVLQGLRVVDGVVLIETNGLNGNTPSEIG